MKSNDITCDIFCNVIDNYGDIGVCWRLARQLANEHDLAVRLWVDDVASFAKLCPGANATLDTQMQRGVEVRVWAQSFVEAQPADIVIAAFACKLPESYVDAMTQQAHTPVWINLEYLSAEPWVAGCHRLPSPHPRLPLTKYFFFPGFTPDTGGLMLERDLLARRDAFLNDVSAQQAYWRGLGMQMPDADVLKVSMFAYENDALPALLDTWAQGAQRVLCLVPEGRILPQVAQYFGEAGLDYQRGNLQVHVLPFVAQEDYDPLLWACDVNFVRGEDSCVRAQWAGKPFIWQIYPQHDAVHWDKLQAFLDLYARNLSKDARHAVQGLWRVWNASAGSAQVGSAQVASAQVASAQVGSAQVGLAQVGLAQVGLAQSLVRSESRCWTEFAAQREVLESHALDWAGQMAKNPLALNLLDFCQKVGKIRAFKIEGQ